MNHDKKFELEQAILNAWHVVDDIDMVYKNSDGSLDQDTMMNVLLGIKTLYQLKFEHLFDVFEEYISDHEPKQDWMNYGSRFADPRFDTEFSDNVDDK